MILIVFGGRNARLPRMWRNEPGPLHAERTKNMLRRILIERLARKPLHQRSQHHEVDIAINKRRARSPLRRRLKCHPIRRLLPFPLLRQIQVRSESRVVHQQLPDRNILLPILPKFGKILRDGIVHAKLSLLPKLHDRRRGHDNLGQRRAIKHGIERHRLPPRFNRAAAISLAIHHTSVVPDDKDSTRNLLFGDGFSDDGVENGETGIKRSLGECGGREQESGQESGDQQIFRRVFHVCCDST